jgi:pimeloyl-ACP methyl ester carboxylesterase
MIALMRRPALVRSLERLSRYLPSPSVTVSDWAADAGALLDHLGVGQVHVVGHSIGGVIALQLANDQPDRVHSLALLEPALQMVPSAPAHQEEAILPAIIRYLSGDKEGAVDHFLGAVFGSGWRSAVETAVPGGVSLAIADADTFFAVEGRSMAAWHFRSKDAAKLTMPILSVVGTESPSFFQDGRRLLHEWFGSAEELDLPNANHLLQVQDPKGIADGLKGFFDNHPIDTCE